MIRSAPGDGRRRVYRREDVDRLRARSAARAGHGAVAAGALRWGEPVLDTAISGITAAGHEYRGKNAIEIARGGARFETVARWLWEGRWDPDARFAPCEPGIDLRRAARLIGREARPIERLIAGSGLLTAAIAGRGETEPETLVRRLSAMLALGGAARPTDVLEAESIAEAVLKAFAARASRRAIAAIDLALVLMADHELNASTFACRVAAGGGAELHACIVAALATLSGPAHGGSSDRIEAMLAEASGPEEAARVLRDRRRRGDALPGFGHPLYPGGDPRTAPLVEAAHELAPKNAIVRKVRAFVAAMELAGGEPATVDTGLVALAGALGMPRGAAGAIMAIGRSAGWIAHAREQREAGFALRPRARYSPMR